MAEALPELRAILDSAEQAASVQDFASAEQYLRQAASLQEARLGPNHPDLANTLNNLGIVCERTDKSADAEACYRRAYAIARSTLPGDDPLVLTSGQNLKDFCDATGRPFEPVAPPPPPSAPPPAPPTPAPPAPHAAAPVAPAPVAPAPAASSPPPVPSPPVGKPSAAPVASPSAPVASPPAPAVAPPPARKPSAPAPLASSPAAVPFAARAPVPPPSSARVERGDPLGAHAVNVTPVAVPVDARGTSRHRNAIWVVVGSLILLALVILLADRLSQSSDSGAPDATTETPRVEAPPSEPTPAPAASAAREAPTKAAAPERPTSDAVKKPPATDTRATTGTNVSRPTSSTVSLVESRLCRSLNNWRCTPATNPAEPGVFIFYTRVKSARDTAVQHRWYLNGSLRRTVDLRVAANASEGYRTYSRNTVAAERRGNWTIELRDANGALLHEERFLVQ